MKLNWMKFGVSMLAVVAMAGCVGPGVDGPSDEELIRSLISDMATALQAGDIEKAMMAYDEEMEWDQGGKAEYQEFLQGAKDADFLAGMTVTTSDMEVVVDGDSATAEPMEAEGDFGVLTFEFELTKTDGAWLVTQQAQY